MIEDYLRQLDDVLSAHSEVTQVVVFRRHIVDTGWEKVLNYRYRIILSDGGLMDMSERILESGNALTVTKYRFHWQNTQGQLIRRWDNAPHHKDVETFPNHLHDGTEGNVVPHSAVTGLDALKLILSEVG